MGAGALGAGAALAAGAAGAGAAGAGAAGAGAAGRAGVAVPADGVGHPTAFSGFCVLYGYNVPFDAARLQSLYRNHGDYVHQFAQQSIAAVRDGFWLLPDAIQAIERAARSRVP